MLGRRTSYTGFVSTGEREQVDIWQTPVVLVFDQTLVQVQAHPRVNNAATSKFRQGTCDFLS